VAPTLAQTPPPQAQPAPTPAELKARGARQMSADEISASRIGNTWYYVRLADGGKGAVYHPDERNRVAIIGGRKRESLWWMEGDRVCEEAMTVVGLFCGIILVIGAQMHVCIDGQKTCFATVRQVPGNPEKL
jgi:hypothetical protein